MALKSPVPQVVGEVMSNLILRHSLPNANHRTGIAMLQFCIESVDPDFEMPRTHVDDETGHEWVDPFIGESKQLTTVRRNTIRFKQLEELDIDCVERKDGIQIRLADFELDIHWSEALSTYATQHEAHCTDFAHEVCQRVERDDPLTKTALTQQEFIDYLESGLVERDVRDLF